MASSSSASTSQIQSSSILFARGVIARLSVWSTLRIAIQEAWGGPGASEKRTLLASEIVDAFELADLPPDDQDIEDLLLQIMEDEFEVVVDDGSAESVAKDIVKIWQEIKEGKSETLQRFEGLAENVKSKRLDVVHKVASDDEEWDDEEEEGSDEDVDMVEEVPQLLQPPASKREEPEVDEDGFTVVKSKGKARR